MDDDIGGTDLVPPDTAIPEVQRTRAQGLLLIQSSGSVSLQRLN